MIEEVENWNRKNTGRELKVEQSFRLKKEGEDLQGFLAGFKAVSL